MKDIFNSKWFLAFSKQDPKKVADFLYNNIAGGAAGKMFNYLESFNHPLFHVIQEYYPTWKG